MGVSIKKNRLLPENITVLKPGVSYESLLRDGMRTITSGAVMRTDDHWIEQQLHDMRQARARQAAPPAPMIGLRVTLKDLQTAHVPSLQIQPSRQEQQILALLHQALAYGQACATYKHERHFNLETICRNAILALQDSSDTNGLQIILDYDSTLATAYFGISPALQPLITTLLQHAVSVTTQGHILLRVNAQPNAEAAAPNQTLHISIEDTGPGLSADILTQIFQNFPDAAPSRHLIDKGDYAVWIDSELGKGTTFGFRITLQPNVKERTFPVTPATVFIQDERFITRTILERQLKSLGHNVQLSRSWSETKAAVPQISAPDMMIIDPSPSELDHYGERIAMLRNSGWKTPIYMLGSTTLPAQDDNLYTLSKPLTHDELARHIPKIVPKTKPKLLAIEDNLTHQRILEKMLRDYDCEWYFASNDQQAADIYAQNTPDLVLLNPMSTAIVSDLRQALRALNPQALACPIIAVTLPPEESAQPASKQNLAEFDDVLYKPLRRSAISQMLMQHLPHIRPHALSED